MGNYIIFYVAHFSVKMTMHGYSIDLKERSVHMGGMLLWKGSIYLSVWNWNELISESQSG